MNNLNKLLSEIGFLTAEGKAELEKNLAPAVKDLLSYASTEAEVNMLGSALVHYVAEMISSRKLKIKESATQFDSMTDQEFDKYLFLKYGEGFTFVDLNDEEMRRAGRLSKETVEKIVQSE
jgi:hypothetical protein